MAPIIEYLLNPYCMVKQHKTIIDDPLEDHVKNIVSSYDCTAWCEDARFIPRQIKMRQVPVELLDMTQPFMEPYMQFRKMEASIKALIN